MKNQYKITKDLFKSWAKEYHLHGAADIVSFIYWCIIGVGGLYHFASFVYYGTDCLYIFVSALMVVVAVYELFFSGFVFWSKRYKQYAATYGVSEWMRTIEFLDDEIVLTDHTSVCRYKYENIQKIREKNNVVMIFMKHNIAIRLYKDAFVEGTWESCRNFLNTKKPL